MKTPLLPGPRAAFTLVEMLVAMAVLALLITLIGEMFSETLETTLISNKFVSADNQARQVFDRMAGDFAQMLKRPNVDSYFNKQTGNDEMVFFSQAPGFTDASATDPGVTSLVGYRINSALQLERLGRQLTWDGAASSSVPGAPVFLTYPNGAQSGGAPQASSTIDGNWASTLSAGDGQDDWHVLGDGVFRLEFCFLKTDGTYVNPPQPGSSSYAWPPLRNVAAVVVAIAVLDTQSRKMVSSTSSLVGALQDVSTPSPPSSPLMATVWNKAVMSAGFAQTAGIPLVAASQVHVYQRTFYLDLPSY